MTLFGFESESESCIILVFLEYRFPRFVLLREPHKLFLHSQLRIQISGNEFPEISRLPHSGQGIFYLQNRFWRRSQVNRIHWPHLWFLVVRWVLFSEWKQSWNENPISMFLNVRISFFILFFRTSDVATTSLNFIFLWKRLMFFSSSSVNSMLWLLYHLTSNFSTIVVSSFPLYNDKISRRKTTIFAYSSHFMFWLFTTTSDILMVNVLWFSIEAYIKTIMFRCLSITSSFFWVWFEKWLIDFQMNEAICFRFIWKTNGIIMLGKWQIAFFSRVSIPLSSHNFFNCFCSAFDKSFEELRIALKYLMAWPL